MRTMLKFPAITAAVLVVAGIIVFSSALIWTQSNYGLQWLQSRVNEMIPGRIHVDSHKLSLFPLEINLYGAVLYDDQNNPLAGFSHFHAQIELPALLKKELFLRTVALEEPWADLVLEENGDLNIIASLSSPSEEKEEEDLSPEGPGFSFNIVLPSISLIEGRFSFKKANAAMDLEASGITLSADGDLMARSANLQMEILCLQFATDGVHPEPAHLGLRAQFENDHLSIPALDVTSGETVLHLSGATDGLPPETEVETAIFIQSQLSDLKKIVEMDGDYQGPLTANVMVKGKIENPDATLALTIEEGRIAGRPVDHGSLLINLHDRKMVIEDTTWRLADGAVLLKGDIDLQETFPSGLLSPPENSNSIAYTFALASDIPNLNPWLNTFIDLNGSAAIDASIKGKGIAWPDLTATAALTATGSDLIAPGMDRPIGADATLKVEKGHGQMIFSHLDIVTDGARLNGESRIQMNDRSLDGKMSLIAEDLSRILTVMGVPTVSGACDASLSASGSLDKPRFLVDLTSSGLEVDQYTIGDIDAHIRLENGTLLADRISLSNMDSVVTATGDARLLAPGSFNTIENPTFNLTIESDHLNPKHFFDYASGDFTFNGKLSGSFTNPQGQITLTGHQINLVGQPIESLSLDARVDELRLWLDRLSVAVSPGEQIQGGGWLDMDQTMDLHLGSDGIAVSTIQPLKDIFPGNGMLGIDVTAKGALKNPDIKGQLAVTDIIVNNEPMEAFHLDFTLHDRVAKASGNLNFKMDAACDLAKGDFNALFLFDQTETAGYFKAAGIPDLRGALTGRVEASGNLNRAAQASASVDIKEIHLFHKDTTLISSKEIVAQLDGQKLSIPGFEATLLSSGNLRIKGEVHFDGPLDLTIDGRIPMAAASPFSEVLTDAKGFISLNGNLSGNAADARYDARIDLEKIGFTVPELAQQLHDLNGAIVLTPETIQLKDFKGFLDTGSFMITGAIGHDNFQPIDFDVKIQARSLPIEIPDTLTVLTNSDIRIKGENRKAKATGEIVLFEGVYYKDININLLNIASSATARRRAEPVAKKPLELPYMESVDLNIAVRHRQPFEVQNNLAELAIRPDLKIRGTLAKPIINGRAQVSDGTVTFQRKEFDVKKGVIDFVDPYQTKADIDIESETRIREWTIGLSVKGTMDNLVFTLTSVPSETEADILSLILFGRTTRELSAGESGSSRTTNQIVAEMIADTLSDDIQKKIGIDILELETTDGSDDNSDGGVKVTVGKHLSDRMTVKYAVETVDGESMQWAIMEYKLLERIMVNGSQSTSGLFGGELIYRIEFR